MSAESLGAWPTQVVTQGLNYKLFGAIYQLAILIDQRGCKKGSAPQMFRRPRPNIAAKAIRRLKHVAEVSATVQCSVKSQPLHPSRRSVRSGVGFTFH
jgi:hypothetical protein